MNNGEINEFVADVVDRRAPVDEDEREKFDKAVESMVEAGWAHVRTLTEALTLVERAYTTAVNQDELVVRQYEYLRERVDVLANVLDTPQPFGR